MKNFEIRQKARGAEIQAPSPMEGGDEGLVVAAYTPAICVGMVGVKEYK